MSLSPIAGDANYDGVFNSDDLVQAFASGTFERDVEAGWVDGDWNSDGVFSSRDIVAALVTGAYERQPTAAVPEPSSLLLMLLGIVCATQSGCRKAS